MRHLVAPLQTASSSKQMLDACKVSRWVSLSWSSIPLTAAPVCTPTQLPAAPRTAFDPSIAIVATRVPGPRSRSWSGQGGKGKGRFHVRRTGIPRRNECWGAVNGLKLSVFMQTLASAVEG